MHVLPVLIALSGPAISPSQAAPFDYERVIHDYRGGDSTATARIAAWPRDALKAAVEQLEARASRSVPSAELSATLRAAAVLHADASFALDADGRFDEGGFQRTLGRALLDATPHGTSRAASPELPFACSWWLTVAYHFRADTDAIRVAYGEADRACGGRPELWLAFGALSEFLYTFGDPRSADLDGWPSRAVTATLPKAGREGQGTLAVTFYRRAARANPELWEARLRLGRVLGQAGRSGEARAELDAVLASCQDPQLRYLAHLFLGDLLERAGQEQAALTRYRSAVQIAPSAGSATSALARSLLVAGDAGAARDFLRPYLSRDAARDVTDPWLSYSAGIPIDAFEHALERLREVVRVEP